MTSPTLTLIAAQSLDGFIARHATAGSDFVSRADREHLATTLKQFDFYLMGAETYRVIRVSLREKLKPGLLRVVLTRKPEDFAADAIPGVLEFTSEKIPALVARLSSGGKKGAVLGGAQIYRQCLAANLVDECLLTIEPVLFGEGTPLVRGKIDARFKLQETKALSADTVLLRYRVESFQQHRQPMHWFPYFILWVAGIILGGAVIGAVAFPLAGAMIESEKTFSQLVVKGMRFMSFYFMIWAPGVALVATVARQYRLRK